MASENKGSSFWWWVSFFAVVVVLYKLQNIKEKQDEIHHDLDATGNYLGEKIDEVKTMVDDIHSKIMY